MIVAIFQVVVAILNLMVRPDGGIDLWFLIGVVYINEVPPLVGFLF